MYLFQDLCLCESEKEKLNSQLLSWLCAKISSSPYGSSILGAGEILTCALKLLLPQKQEVNTDNSNGLNSHSPSWT